MSGRASGVCSPALWKSTIEPLVTLLVTRFVISSAEMPFQSSESPLAALGNARGGLLHGLR